MLQCPLGKEVMPLRQSGELESHYTMLRERERGGGGGGVFFAGDEDTGDFDSQKIDISIFEGSNSN